MATLYATPDRARFFHVPDDARLPPGDLVVRSLTGKKLEADPIALDVYEVPEDEAMRIARELLGGFADKVRAVTMSAAAALAKPPPLDPDAVKAREERVASYLKLGREQLHDDPAALGAALKGALQNMVDLARETVNEPGVAEARLKDVAEAFRQEGAPAEAAEAIETAVAKLREALASPEVLGKIEQATAELRSVTEALKRED